MRWYKNVVPEGVHAEIHSFENVYKCILDDVQPASVFEWGPGRSTDLALDSGAFVTSVEHDKEWLHKHHERLIQLFVAQESNQYICSLTYDATYELYFVDGRRRVDCMRQINRCADEDVEPLIVLHDAQRLQYRNGLTLFDYGVYFGDGTAVVCNSKKRYEQLSNLVDKIRVI